ncbi:retention module-containing protein, partial [Pseudomonas sp. TTU2014-080ASC]|uniref:retention module-containing protein n=1 Tax=Pseudomonas sp. TTU2014-080ASC TaxID=1729724 RepID=UPI000AC5AC83
MATLLGVVGQIVGEVFAVSADGTRRALSEGDRLFAGETLETGANGSVAIRLSNGQTLTVGRDSSLELTPQLLAGNGAGQAPQPVPANTAPSDQDLTDVERLQAAIEAGDDPTQMGEATAAGPGAGGAGGGGAGGGNSFVMLSETGGSIDPEIGFPTAGLSRGPLFPDPVIGANEPEVVPTPIPTPVPTPVPVDYTPGVDIDYTDSAGTIQAGPGVVQEAALGSGSNPASSAERTFGTITINSPDGVSALQIQDVNGNWVDVTNGGTVLGKYGVLSVDAAGNWTYTLTDNTLDHSNTSGVGSSDVVSESFPTRMFDLDGDVSPTVNINVQVLDDGPSVQVAQGVEWLSLAVLDESLASLGGTQGDGIATAVLSAAAVQAHFVTSFGADGGSSTYGYELNGSNVATGLFALSGEGGKGAEIVLNQSGNVITGSAGGANYFTLTINAATGEVTINLLKNIWHSNAGSFDDAEVLQLPEGVLKLVKTVTDGDGDKASAALDLGAAGVINFEDDGPTISAQAFDSATLQVDESNFELDATANISSFFTVDGGSDGVDDVDYSLVLNSSASGLVDTATGQNVFLVLNSAGVVEGRVGNAQGAVVFTLSVDGSGNVKLDQLRAIQHSDTSNHNEAKSLAAGVVSVKATVTDGDGDKASASLDIGKAISFLDDGPSISAKELGSLSLQVDETNLNTAATSSFTLASLFTANAGADGQKALDFALKVESEDSGLFDTLTGEEVKLSLNAEGEVIGTISGDVVVFTVSVTADGKISLNQERAVKHPVGGNSHNEASATLDGKISVVGTITDGDNDTATATANIGKAISFLDDGPSISAKELGSLSLQVDETNLNTAATSSFTLASLFTSAAGADGQQSLDFALKVESEDSGLFDTLTGEEVKLSLNAEGEVIGTISGDVVVFTVSVTADGKISLNQERAVKHPVGGNSHNEASATLDGKISVVGTITDGDNDTATATANIGKAISF